MCLLAASVWRPPPPPGGFALLLLLLLLLPPLLLLLLLLPLLLLPPCRCPLGCAPPNMSWAGGYVMRIIAADVARSTSPGRTPDVQGNGRRHERRRYARRLGVVQGRCEEAGNDTSLLLQHR